MYGEFADIYDLLTKDIDYDTWSDRITELFHKYSFFSGLVLDLGCGTGNMTIRLSEKGYNMIGVESSVEMLGKAKAKSGDGETILWLNQEMENFELYGTVGAVISTLDSINYITEIANLRKVFALVYMYLDNGGLFIFDVNSSYKLEKVLGNNVFYSVEDDITYIWQSKYDGRKRLCTFDLTFFVNNGSGDFKRFDEYHKERLYTMKEITDSAINAGFAVEKIFDGLRERKPSAKSERWMFVCRKKVGND